MAELVCYWIEGQTAECWIFARSKKKALEEFFDKYGMQKIRYIGRDDG